MTRSRYVGGLGPTGPSRRGLAVVSMAAALSALVAGCAAEPTQGTAPDRASLSSQQDALIFGNDERQDWGAMPELRQAWSRSVALHLLRANLNCDESTCSIDTTPWTDLGSVPLCEDVRFRAQERADDGQCTAFLVGPDLLATAGHCIDATTCAQSTYVFGFAADANGENATVQFPADEVYQCDSIVDRAYTGNSEVDQDWALVRLNQVVQHRAPIPLRYSGAIEDDRAIEVIGHPLGLPVKRSRSMQVRANGATERFYGNGDIFGGNSGSPVFDAVSGVVEGIVVTQPWPRFQLQNDGSGECASYRECPDAGCSGVLSGVQRVTTLVDQVPLFPAGVMATI